QGGACPGFYVNREPFLDVIRMHRAEVNNIGKSRITNEPFVVPQLDLLIDATGTIEGAPGIKPEHLGVFDCSFKPAKGTRSIQYMGHIKMMAATQPFLSGAISKTVNLPHEATVEDVAEAYAESWRQGIKAVAIYRDGSKGTQPLNTSMDAKKEPSTLDVVGSRVLAQLAASQPAVEADLKALEAGNGAKLEVSARQMLEAAAAF